ncbi:sensor histidine kinase [Streptomyces sp. NPDC058613]|uniref:sensor histidine kinase n=1 Tax=Streptomyces sp. NPDC058613 TaxID=3346556 RepID=UPI0036664DD1
MNDELPADRPGKVNALPMVARSLLQDLLTIRPDPLPPLRRPRRLGRLPHVCVAAAAVVVVIATSDQLGHRNQLGLGYGILLALLQGGALLLALAHPAPAWWLSLTGAGIAAAVSAPHLLENTPWPWTIPGLVAHAAVLLLLSLRVRTPAACAALAASVLIPFLIELAAGARPYQGNSFPALMLFSLAVVLGATMRGRRTARAQLAEQAALTTVERAQRTLLEERGRIARELHDVVAHHMSVISIQAQVAPHLTQSPTELAENLAGIRQNALDALTELRHMLGVLRSDDTESPHGPQPTLDDLDALVANVRGTGLTVTTEIADRPVQHLDPGAQLALYRIAQEAFSNCLRHALGAHVHLRLAHTDDALELDITNTASTTPAPPSPGSGHGLLGMRERTTMLGGHLTAGPDGSGGYRVSARIPLTGLLTAHRDDDTCTEKSTT